MKSLFLVLVASLLFTSVAAASCDDYLTESIWIVGESGLVVERKTPESELSNARPSKFTVEEILYSIDTYVGRTLLSHTARRELWKLYDFFLNTGSDRVAWQHLSSANALIRALLVEQYPVLAQIDFKQLSSVSTEEIRKYVVELKRTVGETLELSKTVRATNQIIRGYALGLNSLSGFKVFTTKSILSFLTQEDEFPVLSYFLKTNKDVMDHDSATEELLHQYPGLKSHYHSLRAARRDMKAYDRAIEEIQEFFGEYVILAEVSNNIRSERSHANSENPRTWKHQGSYADNSQHRQLSKTQRLELLKELELNELATKNEIRSAYRRLVKIWHPDINKSKDAQARFIAIKRAYDLLMK